MNRKSLIIIVEPDKSVIVKAPASLNMQMIEEKIQQKMRWIKKKFVYFDQFPTRPSEKRYIDGESHLYLGSQYILQIEKSQKNKLLLNNKYFMIKCVKDNPSYIKKLLQSWYKRQSQMYFSKMFNDCWDKFNNSAFVKPILKLRQMKTSWGSLSSKGALTLNTYLIQTFPECIEYVLMHELCHLLHFNHSPDFYKCLGSIMPDWIKRKQQLDISLVYMNESKI